MSKTRFGMVLTGLLLLGSNLDAVQAAPPQVKLNIPAQAMDAALNDLSVQSGIQFIFPTREVTGNLKAQSLVGTFSVADALGRLLKDSGLTFEFVNEKTVAIRPLKNGEKAGVGSVADQMRVASAEEVNAASKDSTSTKADTPSEDVKQVIVRDKKVRPYSGANVDIPRTVNDVQPYYIFDSEAIQRSGTANIEDFLKQSLTVNTVAMASGQDNENRNMNLTTVNLRGLGTDKTLILVNGRRMPGPMLEEGALQADLNGIPLSSIERVEVLPSSASGIYGGSAIGGVVNVVLKRDYRGGEVRLNYDKAWDGDSTRRDASLSYGRSLEGGRAHVSLNAGVSDKTPMMFGDRAGILQANMAVITSRDSDYVYGNNSSYPFLGQLPNISLASVNATTLLTLKNGGGALNSRRTYIPAGTSASTPATQLRASLLANAGQWNLEFPSTSQAPTGLTRRLEPAVELRSLRASAGRQMLPWLEVTMDLLWSENKGASTFNQVPHLVVPAAAITNPFTANVRIMTPDAGKFPIDSRSQNRSATLGAKVQLPFAWTALADYTWSENRYRSIWPITDTTARTADLASGALNPFVDTLLYPLNLEKYTVFEAWQSESKLQDIALRGSGPLLAPPWGQPIVTVGLERRISSAPERTFTREYPFTACASNIETWYAHHAITDGGYLEATVPLVKQAWLPAVHSLELQLAGRGERYKVDTGTRYQRTYHRRIPVFTEYGLPNIGNQQPLFSDANYSSVNYTFGLKYQPIAELTIRASQATAFLPPTPYQLISDPVRVAEAYESIIDPVTLQTINGGYEIVAGGNPDLKPQNSRSLNAGIIWEPQWAPLSGLRVNAEYYRIGQFDTIARLTPQQIVSQAGSYPGRVVRDAGGTITRLDATMVNLYRKETEGFDLSLDCSWDMSAGKFNVRAAQSIILNLKEQYSQSRPEYDLVSHVNDGGAAKRKSNVSLSWERDKLMLSWTARYFGSYAQYGVPGGPASQASANGGIVSVPLLAVQGSWTIPSQAYHDVFASYSFRNAASRANRLMNGLILQFGVRNVFDSLPPLDAFMSRYYYVSPFGDMRLRTYWMNATLGF